MPPSVRSQELFTRDANMIPLIIDGKDYIAHKGNRAFACDAKSKTTFSGADQSACQLALSSCDSAFVVWSQSTPRERRRLLQQFGKLLEANGDALKKTIQEEIHCDELWAEINLQDTLGLIEETAALVTADCLQGSIPPLKDQEAHGFVYNEPLGVILGIAPWNAPLILGVRAIIGPIAAGNTAILKGSELSPRTHHAIARLFNDAGFPPGVLNFILHTPEDAVEVFDFLIEDVRIRKCNFTGSTAVGRSIAQKAGAVLKPVLLELGGKNCAIVLEDGDVETAARGILLGAFLNNGQICMSTDTVILVGEVANKMKQTLHRLIHQVYAHESRVISSRSHQKIQSLLQDAARKGAGLVTPEGLISRDAFMPTLISDITPDMQCFVEESFGPVLGITVVKDEDEAVRLVNSSGYGLSAAVWSKSHWRALGVARKLRVGAVHINAPTVHDEQTLPHGGTGLSGYGRFGATWGLREWVQTKTIIMHK